MTNRGKTIKPEHAEWKMAMAAKGKATQPEWVGVDTAEYLTDRSRWCWRKDAYSGKIASTKIGRRLLIPRSEIDRVMLEGLRPRLEQK